MIKCAHLNMSQLYVRVRELSNISVLSRFVLPENPQRKKLIESYIKVSQTKTGQICPFVLVGADPAHTMTTVFKQMLY